MRFQFWAVAAAVDTESSDITTRLSHFNELRVDLRAPVNEAQRPTNAIFSLVKYYYKVCKLPIAALTRVPRS